MVTSLMQPRRRFEPTVVELRARPAERGTAARLYAWYDTLTFTILFLMYIRQPYSRVPHPSWSPNGVERARPRGNLFMMLPGDFMAAAAGASS